MALLLLFCFSFLSRLDDVQKSLVLPSASASVLAIASASASASTFTLKFFKSSYFLNHLMDLVHIWYNNRYRSKVSISNILPWPIGHKGKKLCHKVKS